MDLDLPVAASGGVLLGALGALGAASAGGPPGAVLFASAGVAAAAEGGSGMA